MLNETRARAGCPRCGETLFLIPFDPRGQAGAARCTACGEALGLWMDLKRRLDRQMRRTDVSLLSACLPPVG